MKRCFQSAVLPNARGSKQEAGDVRLSGATVEAEIERDSRWNDQLRQRGGGLSSNPRGMAIET